MMFLTSPRTVLAAVLLASAAVVQAQELCRCEAEFEMFYDRRRLLKGPAVLNAPPHGSRELSYRYDDSYVNDDGYYVVNGVVVLPSDSDFCIDQPVRPHSASIENFMALFGGRRDLMEEAGDYDDDEEDEDMEEEMEAGEVHRNLKGSSSSKSKGGGGDYYYGKGKGKVRIMRVE